MNNHNHASMDTPPPDERLVREQQFHDSRFGSEEDVRRPLDKYYTLMQLPRRHYSEIVLRHGKGKELLDYGCSQGESAITWARQGAITTGIDLSGEAIRTADAEARAQKLDIRFLVMNAEELQFDAESFDVVAGTGILHHLDLEKACSEIARVLRNDGHAVFIEPLGHNPVINLYRKLTPAMRSEDEHPLTMLDLKTIERYFTNVELTFYNITTLLAVPLRSTFMFRPLYAALRALDSAMFALAPFTRRYAWMVLLHCSNPRRSD